MILFDIALAFLEEEAVAIINQSAKPEIFRISRDNISFAFMSSSESRQINFNSGGFIKNITFVRVFRTINKENFNISL